MFHEVDWANTIFSIKITIKFNCQKIALKESAISEVNLGSFNTKTAMFGYNFKLDYLVLVEIKTETKYK